MFSQETVHSVASATPPTWEDWLEVELRGNRYRKSSNCEASMHVAYRSLKRGLDSASLLAYTIEPEKNATLFPEYRMVHVTSPVEDSGELRGMDSCEMYTEHSYLPATAANIAVLDALTEKLAALRCRYSEFLQKDPTPQSLFAFKHWHGLAVDAAINAAIGNLFCK